MKFLIPIVAGLTLINAQLPKILSLHGGGGSANSMAAEASDLVNTLRGEYEFVFASIGSANTNEVWWRDPPSKDNPTTDPNHAADMVRALDAITREQGPFYAILGYSQGAAAVPVYLSNVPPGTFEKAIMFCGYLPTTHTGLVSRINQAAPFGDISALTWLGVRDTIISNSMSLEQANKFTNPIIVQDRAEGHIIPGRGSETFESVLSFIRGSDVTPSPPAINPPSSETTDGSSNDKEEVDEGKQDGWSSWDESGNNKDEVDDGKQDSWSSWGGNKVEYGYGDDKGTNDKEGWNSWGKQDGWSSWDESGDNKNEVDEGKQDSWSSWGGNKVESGYGDDKGTNDKEGWNSWGGDEVTYGYGDDKGDSNNKGWNTWGGDKGNDNYGGYVGGWGNIRTVQPKSYSGSAKRNSNANKWWPSYGR